MYKNVYEVLDYLGNQTGLFKPIGDEILRLKDENKELRKSIDDLIILNLGGM